MFSSSSTALRFRLVLLSVHPVSVMIVRCHIRPSWDFKSRRIRSSSVYILRAVCSSTACSDRSVVDSERFVVGSSTAESLGGVNTSIAAWNIHSIISLDTSVCLQVVFEGGMAPVPDRLPVVKGGLGNVVVGTSVYLCSVRFARDDSGRNGVNRHRFRFPRQEIAGTTLKGIRQKADRFDQLYCVQRYHHISIGPDHLNIFFPIILGN